MLALHKQHFGKMNQVNRIARETGFICILNLRGRQLDGLQPRTVFNKAICWKLVNNSNHLIDILI